MTKSKSNNIFVRYFADFGIKQISELAMLVGAIVLIVGLSISVPALSAALITIEVGLGIYIAATGLAIFRNSKIIADKEINHRSPEYKSAVLQLVEACVIFVLAVFGLIWALVV